MSLLSLIGKGLRAPLTVLRLLVDHAAASWWLRLNGVSIDGPVRIVGLPIIKFSAGGTIRLGSGVRLLSRRNSNPLQLRGPCSLCLLQPGARIVIGKGSMLSGVVICAATAVALGERVMVGANTTIVDTDFHPLLPEARRAHPTRDAVTKPIAIGDDVFIGTNVLILKGSNLGAGCVVGAGSVISGEVPARTIVAGNPARVLKPLDSSKVMP